MKKRIIYGTILILVVTGLFALDWWLEVRARSSVDPVKVRMGIYEPAMVGPVLTGLMCVLVVVAVLELSRFAKARGVGILHGATIVGSLAIASFPFWQQVLLGHGGIASAGQLLLLQGLIVLLVFIEQMVRHRIDDAIRRMGVTFLAIAYLGIGAALVLYLRIRGGMEVLILFLATVKCTDIGAYFTGSMIGKHKMIPWLSPGKSWQGLAGGLLAAAGVATLSAWLLGIHQLLWWKAPVFGAVVGLAGQFADLCESLMKRDADVKDSGALVPNFGGVLDIVDSPLLAAPVAAGLLGLLW
ncbi:MAG: phosphatidate cytidylyltransferase [Phycisphaerae bacterium]